MPCGSLGLMPVPYTTLKEDKPRTTTTVVVYSEDQARKLDRKRFQSTVGLIFVCLEILSLLQRSWIGPKALSTTSVRFEVRKSEEPLH